jgi:uracil-DNA glycosylase family 4
VGLTGLDARIIECEGCPRLRAYCREVARVKRRQFRDEDYWGKPVPGFGDPQARLLIVGLAPAAHGANRTGRMFTGDQSGLWLYRALYKAGFSNSPVSESRGDGLRLRDCYITTAARCAPPANKPLPEELQRCGTWLSEELLELKRIQVFLALGKVALHALWRRLPEDIKPGRALPAFAHGAEIPLNDGRVIVCSYHPSQQNTFTGLLTEAMFDRVFEASRGHLRSGDF